MRLPVSVISCALTLSAFSAPLWWPTGLAANDDLASDSANVDFDREIAPLLARRCLGCHFGPEPKGGLDLSNAASVRKGGESGTAIVSGKATDSLVWDRVWTNEMPPKKPLASNEKALLKRWINAGAKWGATIDRFRYTSDSRAGYDWWSLQPLERPKLLDLLHAGTSRNPIDLFVRRKLQEHGLTPSVVADRRTLIRRLSFGLLGLPPTAKEVKRFLADQSATAYEDLVDRLLDSPHYGERWARHWLDIARFGESQGFERDKLRDHSWRYRDWVVDAFNQDMPFDKFARLQLAGDVLQPGDFLATTATGFLVGGAYDEVGQSQQSAVMKAVVRQDELEDYVSTIGQTFLGLTIHCARCHDHKFDPIRQAEYYRFTAALSGIRPGERNVKLARTKAVNIEKRLKMIESELAHIMSPIHREILAQRKGQSTQPLSPPKPFARWEFDTDLRDEIGKLHGSAFGSAHLKDGSLVLNGSNSYVATNALSKDLAEKTLEVWIKLADLSQRGGGAISLQSLDGQTFDAIVYGERESHRWMSGSNGFSRTQSFQGAQEDIALSKVVHIAIVYSADGTITGFRNGKPYGKAYRSTGSIRFLKGKSQIVFGLRHGSHGGNRMLSGAIQRAQLYDRALSPREVAASAGVKSDHVSESEILARMTPTAKEARQHLIFERKQLRDQRRRFDTARVYGVAPRKPGQTHRLVRGNPASKAESVTAGGVAAVTGVDAEFGLLDTASDAERRKKLAAWITDSGNPLFARVIVNRLWHYHFGIGLVETPSDFGFNGGRPSHPQLLDWLATELIVRKWSLKDLHRVIVTSATYRQSSGHRAAAAKIDADNRLLWRKSPLRLEAEAVRDAVLAVAGELNRDIGGPGFHDFRTYVHNTQFYFMLDPIGHSFNRRSLYRTWVRSGRSQFLDVFDCPDPSTKAPRRAVTTTPLQALAMMNNSFILRMSNRLAQRLQQEQVDNPTAQIETAFNRSFGRKPDAEEVEMSRAFIDQHGLAALCRVLFNSNEFLYVE